MSLMDAMSRRLGPIDSWPTYILQLLFLDRPSPVRTSGLKVISFFYGNGVPPAWAYTFYNACNVRGGDAASRFVEDQTKAWYYVWRRSWGRRHMAEYYDIESKKFYYINGYRFSQQEPVLPEVTTMELGVVHTSHPQRIHRRLQQRRDLQM